MKSIIVLGGSKLQLDLIFEVKKLYFKLYLFDMNENCIGRKYTDEFYAVDIKDKKKVLELSKKIKPSAILTIATEVGNLTSCYVSEKLGLNSNSYKVAKNTTNKLKMKKICSKFGIKTALYNIIKMDNKNFSWNRFPSIIKPIDSSAGRGVSFVQNNEQVTTSINKAFEFSDKKRIIIEEYLLGRQYSVETISSNKKHYIVSIVEEYITEPPKIIEKQQLLPARLNNTNRKKIERFINKILDSFNITYGACHIEIKDFNNELYLIEIASRMGGWRSELMNIAFGISYSQLLIFSVLNKEIKINKLRNDYAIVKMILDGKDLLEYEYYKKSFSSKVFSDLNNTLNKEIKESKHLADSNGYYFLHIQNKKDLKNFIGKHK